MNQPMKKSFLSSPRKKLYDKQQNLGILFDIPKFFVSYIRISSYKVVCMKKQYSKFLRILITGMLCIGYFSISSSLAQISEGGLPPSFQFAGSLRSEKLAEQVPVNFSVEDLKTVDAWRVSQDRIDYMA